MNVSDGDDPGVGNECAMETMLASRKEPTAAERLA
jgi:hypothetical protein